ncbi:NADH dehydrogenase [ubiquinone] 1 alpha subcomplex subunit 11 [Pocillopora verrucosa]|uniref:NADH dehydrogenase [ubiquinone] 1 alpha subcomplex subunit 11 n=2 Tax=Pocillopora TaxID=46730 RepID=A0A3M6TFB3_POCDA|nr:uncharacterized protein LOC113678417 [Pocillopora damicornis]XP_058950425.1 uncharacterized protein LOC131778052 [Pocillopora verrucosa]RMX40092.1 hypothetical protein pdam_00002229 [Pocillopora damicornis]
MPTTPKFDEPWMDELDGHNCVSRAISFGARGAFVGGIYGAAWSALRIPDPHPTPLILQSFILMKNNSILVGGAASLFALTTCTAASMREKDDHFNWALGGAASGVLIGFSKSSWGLGCGLATAFAAAGALAKYSGVYKHPLRTDRVYV